MLSLLVGALALATVVALLALIPAEPWAANSELWFEQFAPRPRRDSFAEELLVMRLDAESAPQVIPVARKAPVPAVRPNRVVPQA